jgi:hypothetical protein
MMGLTLTRPRARASPVNFGDGPDKINGLQRIDQKITRRFSSLMYSSVIPLSPLFDRFSPSPRHVPLLG